MNKIYRYSSVVFLVVSSMAYATNGDIPVKIEQGVRTTVTQEGVVDAKAEHAGQITEEENSDSKKKNKTRTSIVEYSEEDTVLHQVIEENVPAVLASTPIPFNDDLLVLCVGEEATYTISTTESRVLVDFDDGSQPTLINLRDGIKILFKKPGNYYVMMTPMNTSGQLIEYQKKAVYTTVYRCYLPVNHNLKNVE
ncbi:hypothetical protein [Myroides sp. DW712]|uniref:hypothetical protein n=1 Tax=Myroides sp. DW712 TaxID=3389800 RepID=UPI00397A46D8